MNYPENHGKPWTPAEKKGIENWWNWTTTKLQLSEQQAIRAIANEFGRTPYSIQCKLKELGVDVSIDVYEPYKCDEETKEKIRSGGWEGKVTLPGHMADALRYVGTNIDKVIIDEYEEIFMTKVYEEQVLVFGVNVARAVEEQLLELLTSIDSKREALIDINPGNTRYFEKVLGELENAEVAVLAQLDERFS